MRDMKHTMKKNVLALLLALAMVVSLAACGGGGSPEGEYHLTKLEAQGMSLDMDQLAEMAGVDVDITLKLNADKTFSLDMSALGMGESLAGTWSTDNGLTLTVDGESVPVKLNGSTIVLEEDGTSMTFEKG